MARMSTLHIAGLTGNEHETVKDVAKALLESSELNPRDYEGEVMIEGNRFECYMLPKFLAKRMILSYGMSIWHRLMVRWAEMEKGKEPTFHDSAASLLVSTIECASMLGLIEEVGVESMVSEVEGPDENDTVH